ncbi:syntaxin-1A [Amia ocellicauda]|uniref:syntaxin-1A n=1 Tax=Amia ocellicauda TaxID=2972642 RepID=UPI003463F685
MLSHSRILMLGNLGQAAGVSLRVALSRREMKDRLEELRGYVEEEDGNDDQGFPGSTDDSPSYFNPAFQEEMPKSMEGFFCVVAGVCRQLDCLQELSGEIAVKQEQVLCSTSKEEVCSEKQLLGELKGEFAAEARAIQSQLSRMKEAEKEHGEGLVESRDDRGALGMSVEGRIRQCQFNTLVQRHREAVGRHYARETEYVGRLQEQIVRQTQLAGLQLGEEEVRWLVESPQAPQLVGADIKVTEARRHLALAQERHQQLLALEQQIAELHILFLSLEIMVSEQQAQLDRIEYNVLRTVDYVSQSNLQMKKAVQYQRKSRLSAALAAALGLCACCTCLTCTARHVP